MVRIREKVVCADGFRMSIQASSGHYCTPKVDIDQDANIKYSTVELLVYSYDELLEDYIDSYGDDRDRIGAYVPVNVVVKVLKKHGGAIQGEIPPFDLKYVSNKEKSEGIIISEGAFIGSKEE